MFFVFLQGGGWVGKKVDIYHQGFLFLWMIKGTMENSITFLIFFETFPNETDASAALV